MSHPPNCIITAMDRAVLPRLRNWLERKEVAAVDPARVAALAAALEDADPPVTGGRWGSVICYDSDPGRRRLLQLDRRGHLIAALRWTAAGALAWAKCLTASGLWIGLEPRAADHPAWGASDQVWLLEADGAWQPREALTVFQALDWARPDFIPPLAEPRRLPPGAGSAVLNLVSGLMKDQGITGVRYRGPYPTEQLFTTLLESFRYDPREALPLERFLTDGGLDWQPAPYELHRVTPRLGVQLRHQVEKVVTDGLAFYRTEWQSVTRREPRVVRDDGERVVCSLWALGGPIEDRLVLDRSGELVEAPAPRADPSPAAPLPPVWSSALAHLIARESAPPLATAIRDVMAAVTLEWGPVAGDLLTVSGQRIRLSRHLRDVAGAALRGAASPEERAEQALRLVLEVARLLASEIRSRAQSRIEALSEAEQERAWAESEGPDAAFGESVGRLIALVATGGG